MPEIPVSTSPRWADGDRAEPPRTGSELETLNAFLDWQRETLALKCADVPAAQLSARLVEPSGLSLHGLVRHLAGVERWWFRIQFAQEDVPLLYYSDDDPNQDFDDLGGDFAAALETWRAECARSREIVAAAASLDDTGIRRSTGEPISLRWVMFNLLAEYARHNGHADMLRERIDGATGM
ncbi:DinB family protein [Saccharopolyspora shandongensis]|uniref:DinB family protein n=1 Tax=Saccharopolyspora shandongensis TaxID=418495 RepID=UPI0033DD2044